MKLLHLYILKQLIPAFLMALVGFTAIFVLLGLVQQATQQGLNFIQIMLMIPFVVPSSLPYTIPATLLLSITIVYGRMAADNEITATKAAGINVLHLLIPAVVVGIGLSVLTFVLSDRVIPLANLRMKAILVKNVEDMVYGVLRKEHVLKAPGLNYEIHAPRVEGKRLYNTTFKRRTEGSYDLVVFAEQAALEFDLPNRMVKVHMYNAQVINGGAILEVEGQDGKDKIFEVGMPNAGQITPGIRELTLRDVENRIAELRRIHETECGKWVFKALGPISSGHLEQVKWGELVGQAKSGSDIEREVLRLSVEPHMRGAISFGCLTFVLLGCPVAILFQRGDYLSAFISCFLPIILLYYPLLMFGFNLSKEGLAPPIILWACNVLLVFLAVLAFRPVLRH